MPNPLLDSDLRTPILTGAAGCALAGSFAGSLLSVVRARPFWSFTLGTAVNCGMVGFTYLATRTMILQEQLERQREAGYIPHATDENLLFSSAIAGGVTGGIWTGALRGPRGVLPGFVMFALLAGSGQWGWTTARRFRQQVIVASSGSVRSNETAWDVFRASMYQQWNDWCFQMGQRIDWLPMRKMTATEYRTHLQERLALVNAELEDLERELAAAT
ncbi:hypothetical protein THASP1DRAFT_27226 [Thamnocephalis sphaerospora]|uniref:Tim17/Tim22/Tim23/Pmp24 family-domain-containing protein n=1 Tax=Thamnocephalis sphaerospora TaxID=78915 RepID=A0A4P9XZR5_9FUNG|nr:hypothetical protein THASP1DRAFT_27226 [Thamnocephalis sphaerospora]|eukprot:RKP10980.1 hypothetical protein THASP1DRAFT_27226 [Thamnocephalis sphaerospora]